MAWLRDWWQIRTVASAALPVVQGARAHSKMFLGRLYCRMSHHKSVSHRRLYFPLSVLMTLHRLLMSRGTVISWKCSAHDCLPQWTQVSTCHRITNSTEHSPSSEADSSSASQEITRILWKLNFHYCLHKKSPLVHILSQFTSSQPICSRSIWTLPSHLRPSIKSGPLLSGVLITALIHFPATCYTPRPPHPSWFDHLNNTYSVNSINHEAPHYVIVSSIPLPPPHFKNTQPFYSLSVKDKISHCYRTKGKITIL